MINTKGILVDETYLLIDRQLYSSSECNRLLFTTFCRLEIEAPLAHSFLSQHSKGLHSYSENCMLWPVTLTVALGCLLYLWADFPIRQILPSLRLLPRTCVHTDCNFVTKFEASDNHITKSTDTMGIDLGEQAWNH